MQAKPFYFLFLAFICVLFSLQGCSLGTTVLDRNQDKSLPYPDLHDVPKKRAAPSLVEIQSKVQNAKKQHEDSWKELSSKNGE